MQSFLHHFLKTQQVEKNPSNENPLAHLGFTSYFTFWLWSYWQPYPFSTKQSTFLSVYYLTKMALKEKINEMKSMLLKIITFSASKSQTSSEFSHWALFPPLGKKNLESIFFQMHKYLNIGFLHFTGTIRFLHRELNVMNITRPCEFCRVFLLKKNNNK